MNHSCSSAALLRKEATQASFHYLLLKNKMYCVFSSDQQSYLSCINFKEHQAYEALFLLQIKFKYYFMPTKKKKKAEKGCTFLPINIHDKHCPQKPPMIQVQVTEKSQF